MKNFDLKKYMAEGRIHEAEDEKEESKGTEDYMSVGFTGQTSFPKDAKIAKAVVAQLQSGNKDAPIIKAMGEFGDANKAKAWVEKIGPDTVEQRILAVAKKIPTQGLAKKDMPFLPGPKDASGKASDVEDALNPGGKYNVDFKESIDPPAKNTIAPDSKEAEDYMTSGTKDGKPGDDKVTVKVPAGVAASDAKPTQTNILLAKGISMAIGGVSGGDIDAWIGTDGSILDGHHRWAATMLNDPSATLGAAGAIDMKAMGDQTTALKHLTAIGNALGNKTKTKENMENFDLKKYITEGRIHENAADVNEVGNMEYEILSVLQTADGEGTAQIANALGLNTSMYDLEDEMHLSDIYSDVEQLIQQVTKSDIRNLYGELEAMGLVGGIEMMEGNGSMNDDDIME